ncbi:hypothetical protein [Rheinheimera salexigens]|uniref:Uncharacterized protein n=1 Tax=Rheinheimera salexigens TaxID=1628148 RepID=A0A1E7Q7T6_9GAMM|nr:hypothetical protein [Rheinheimera salexigens]OEY70216.1 hypothetical protein BI198_12065 [Rheinheimera salexigens]
MNIDKSKKRIAKKIKMGFQGYPELSIAYSGSHADLAQQVTIAFVEEQGAEPMLQSFTSTADAREDEIIQSTIVKVMERSGAKTVVLVPGVLVSGVEGIS